MTNRSLALIAIGAAAAAFLGIWLLLAVLDRQTEPGTAPARAGAAAVDPAAERKIQATLFYVSEDSLRLVGVDTEVPYGEGTIDQARRIVDAQLGPAPPPLVSAVPPGTALRALYVTDLREAFVDLSREVSAGHPGGSLHELFTVYTIVNALTVNLPAITAVQILVEGQEVETLAGHVDLRHPLQKNLAWVDAPALPDDEPAVRPDRPVGTLAPGADPEPDEERPGAPREGGR